MSQRQSTAVAAIVRGWLRREKSSNRQKGSSSGVWPRPRPIWWWLQCGRVTRACHRSWQYPPAIQRYWAVAKASVNRRLPAADFATAAAAVCFCRRCGSAMTTSRYLSKPKPSLLEWYRAVSWRKRFSQNERDVLLRWSLLGGAEDGNLVNNSVEGCCYTSYQFTRVPVVYRQPILLWVSVRTKPCSVIVRWPEKL